MRISRLDLLAYGHFTNAGFDLPAGTPDIHFVFGLNEAGKSTAMTAVEDLLFGIPHNTRHGFLHDYGSMRLGAAVEGKGSALEFRRRKGAKDTLLNKEGVPLPAGEAVLAPFLGGVEKPFYARMFCLDHERLRQGGREILEAQDDVGQILFSAGAGIAGLRERLRKLHADADSLWGSRRASHRRYFQAEDRLKAAESAIREHTVTAGHWQELRTALDKANEACDALEAEIELKTTETRKLGRIRRVCRGVQRFAELNARIAELGQVVLLAEDASRQLEDALNDDTLAQTRLATLTEQIEALYAERLSLTYDEALLARSDDIEQLHERRIQVRNGKTDLPKRRAELAAAEGDLKRLAAELDWQSDDADAIVSRLPARAKLANARALSKRRGERVTAVQNAKAACEEADERAAAITQEIKEEGRAADVSSLAATVVAVRESGDVDARLAAAEKEAKTTVDAIRKLLKAMRPRIAERTDLASLAVPHKSTVEDYRNRRREVAQHLQNCRDRIGDAEGLLKRHRKEYERIAKSEHAVPAEELQRLRERRDAGWSIIRRKYVDGAAVPASEMKAFASGGNAPATYEESVRDADSAADRRCDKAEATALLATTARQIAEQEEQLEELRDRQKAYTEDEAVLAAEWAALWKGVPLAPLSPDEMLAWLDARAQALQAVEKQAIAEQEAASLQDLEARSKTLMKKELDALGIKTEMFETRSLRVALELAAEVRREQEAKAENNRKLEESLRKAMVDQGRERKSLQEAEEVLAEWKEQWSAAVTLLGLSPAAAPDALDAQIDVIDSMREVTNRISDLKRERIEKIERDIAAFDDEVAGLVAAIAPQLGAMERENAALELERLLKESMRCREQAASIDAKLTGERKKAEECEQTRRDASAVVERLQKVASVMSSDDLRDAIRRSDEMRSRQADLKAVSETLAQDGDGMSVDELTAECAAVDIDQIAAREERVAQELAELRTRQMEVGETRSVARKEFNAVGGDDRAARAAADKQSVLVEMKDIAEEYVRVRSAELLLQWAIDRYRREKQAPLLKRAGELFAMLTDDSFRDLQLEFDEDDKAQLAGIRQDGRKVTISGMSTGSADQLYLALRVAAVEDYLEKAAPLPFIADDLFIHFDDERAAAGFKVLAQLARKTQVLFFTHHQHLLDVARAAIGADVSVIKLSGQVIPLDAASAKNRNGQTPASSTNAATG